LQSRGYGTDVIQFVSPEHTAKNVMIRARRDHSIDTVRARHNYTTLRDYWQVVPYHDDILVLSDSRSQ